MKKDPVLFLCAGEASGDLHAANLMKAILKIAPDTKFVGIGGPRMRELGMECFMHAEKLSVIGFVEVFKNLRFFIRTLNEMVERMKERHVDAFIPIDFPDFNLRLCKKAHMQGIRVVFYVCPQVWAWRKSRIGYIEDHVDQLLTIFPFEEKYFNRDKINVEYIGHPLNDEIQNPTPDHFVEADQGKLVIMPGSRHSEINHHMPDVAKFMKAFHAKYPKVHIHIPCAQTLVHEDFKPFLDDSFSDDWFTLHPPGQSEEVLKAADAALIASGTSTLQGVLSNIPFSLFYRLHPFTFWLGTKLIKLQWVGLANLVAEKEVAKEYLQEAMTIENLTKECENLLWNQPYRQTMYENFSEIRNKLGGPGASERAAESILKHL